MATIGRTDVATLTRNVDGVVKGMRVTMAEDAAAGVSLWAYLQDSAAGDSFRALVVSDSDKQTILAYSDIRTDINTVGWYQFTGGTLATYAPTNGTTIVLSVGSDSAAGSLINQDDAGLDAWAGAVTNIATPTIGVMAADTARDYSLYMEYTVGGGGLPPFRTTSVAMRVR